MPEFTFDFSSPVGCVKPMHAVGQPPMLGNNSDYMHYLAEAHIPYSRLHDVGGMFSSNVYVDIPNIFRDFDADENAESSYDFLFTDHLLSCLDAVGCKPIYRLGVTIENYQSLKAYRIDPPKDFAKWARVCEHIIRHYNEGWANGFHYGIRYFEIWNEPDFAPDNAANQMWHGTKAQFFELFDITAKHLKKVFGDCISVGGYASCGFYYVAGDPRAFGMDEDGVPGDETYIFHPVNKYRTAFFNDFIPYIAEHGTPLDFFSFHCYGDLRTAELVLKYARKKFAEIGRGDVPMMLNEWNNARELMTRGTSYAASLAAGMMLHMQNLPIEMLCYYDARLDVSVYAGLFNPLTREPFVTYYAFKAFGELYTLGTQITSSGNIPYKLYAVGAVGKDGKRAVLVTNLSEHDKVIRTNLDDRFKVYLIDDTRSMEKTSLDAGEFVLGSYTCAFIADYEP